MKKFLALVMAMAMVLALVACGGTNNGSSNNTSGNNTSDNTANDTGDTGDTGGVITVGFAQVGHESDWHNASTKSAQDVFSEANGYDLKFVDCDNDSAAQMEAVRNFIQQGADYIIIDPIVSTGWDAVLTECEDAGIPVIVIDRTIDDSDKYVSWVGSDFKVEGLACGEWLKAYAADKGITEINALVIEGSAGGICYCMNTMSASVSQATGMEMDAISSAVIGGTLLTGGVGNVIGTLFGVLINGTISTIVKTNGKLDSSWPNILTAALLCFFIVLQSVFVKLKERKK